MDQNAQVRQSAVFFDLVAKDNDEARSIRSRLREVDPQNPDRGFKDAVKAARELVPIFEQLNKLLALGTLTFHSKTLRVKRFLRSTEMTARASVLRKCRMANGAPPSLPPPYSP